MAGKRKPVLFGRDFWAACNGLSDSRSQPQMLDKTLAPSKSYLLDHVLGKATSAGLFVYASARS